MEIGYFCEVDFDWGISVYFLQHHDSVTAFYVHRAPGMGGACGGRTTGGKHYA